MTDREQSGDTGRQVRGETAAASASRPSRGKGAATGWLVWAMFVAYAATFAVLSVLRYRTFATGRFDLGNMVQAVWSVAHGGLFETTDLSGQQFSRLGAHVDPILALFAPMWWVWPSPEMLLVAQATIVASGVFPAYWLARRWLGDERLALAGGAMYLLYPALQHATLFDFHPVTLAAPLLMFCIWAAEEARWGVLALCGSLAAITQEQVGLMLVGVAVWLWFTHPDRRRQAAVLAAAAMAWVMIAFWVIIPHHALAGRSPFLSRYSELGDNPGQIAIGMIFRPWEVVEVIATPGRLIYLLTLLLPLFALPLLAPLLAAAALPQFGINLLAGGAPGRGGDYVNPIQTIQFHYAVVLVPFLIAAALLGLARLRRGRPAWLHRRLPWLARPGLVAVVLVGALVVAGARLGPLPIWAPVPGAWNGSPMHTFTHSDRSRALQQAVDLVPAGAPVSATNEAGSHLSDRRRIMLFPVIRPDTQWVLVADTPHTRAVAQHRPTLRPLEFAPVLRFIQRSRNWELVYERSGVSLFRRVVPVDGEGASIVG